VAKDEPREYTSLATGTVAADTYIWQPWFATLDSTIDLTRETNFGGTDGNDSNIVTGDVRLGVFPYSRYPTYLSYTRQDTRVTGIEFGSDVIRDRLDLTSQAIVSNDLRGNLALSYEGVDQPDFGDEVAKSARISVTKLFGSDAVTIGLEHEDRDFESRIEDDEREQIDIATLRHDSRPLKDVDVQSTTTLLREVEDTVPQSREVVSLQGISTAQWYPENLPFTVHGAVRTLSEMEEFGAPTGQARSGETKTHLAAGTVGLNWPVTPQLTTRFGLNASLENETEEGVGESGRAPRVSGTTGRGAVLGSVDYFSLPRELAGFDWEWNSGARAEVAHDIEEGPEQSAAVDLGHNVSRLFDAPLLGAILFSASQLGMVERREDPAEMRREESAEIVPSISHSISFTRTTSDGGATTYIRLSGTDQRELAGREPEQVQLLSLQINRRATIDLDSFWHADFSVQASRRQDGDDQETASAFVNGTVGYIAHDVFDVPDLHFLSEIEVDTVATDTRFGERIIRDDRSGEVRALWKNRLDYALGQLTTSLEGNLFHHEGEFGNSVLFRIRRNFGTRTFGR
jgi:hypothetical protein